MTAIKRWIRANLVSAMTMYTESGNGANIPVAVMPWEEWEKIEEWKVMLEWLRPDWDKKASYIESLKQNLKDADNYIKKQQQRIRELDEENETLRYAVTSHEAKIENQTEAIEELETLEEYRPWVTEKRWVSEKRLNLLLSAMAMVDVKPLASLELLREAAKS